MRRVAFNTTITDAEKAFMRRAAGSVPLATWLRQQGMIAAESALRERFVERREERQESLPLRAQKAAG